jgi:hypothetical protein
MAAVFLKKMLNNGSKVRRCGIMRTKRKKHKRLIKTFTKLSIVINIEKICQKR